MKYPTLSKNLKKYRNKANLTQKELGNKIYKSEISVRKYETGNVNIPPSTLYDICQALNVSIQILLGSDYKQYCDNNNIDIPNKNTRSIDILERATSLAENLKENADSWRQAVIDIKSDPNYLLEAILNHLENTEQYYSPIFVNTTNDKENILPYFTSEQVNNIIKKVTELVKYEIYKIENNIK